MNRAIRGGAIVLLAGWAVIIPPRSLRGMDSSEPISKWIVYKTFDDFRDCMIGAAELKRRGNASVLRPDPAPKPPLELPQSLLEQFAEAECVSDDDLKPQ